MKRHEDYPIPRIQMALNAAVLLAAINYIRGVYGKPLIVSSGYRPGHYNEQAGGAKNSSHLTCEAIDLLDSDGAFAKWCLANTFELAKAGLYMENPEKTKGWVHLQTRRPRSGKLIFDP